MIGVSRQQFGSAVEATAGLIPVVGPTAMNWVSKANFTAAKLNMRRKKVMESVSETLELISQFVDTNVTPALEQLDQQVQQAAAVASDVKVLANTQVADLRQKAQVARAMGGARKKFTRRRKNKKQWRKTRKSKTT